MVIVDSFKGEGVEDLFNQAIDCVSWSPGLSREIKRVLILHQIHEGLCTTRFYCTEVFRLSRNGAKFNSFVQELDSNESLRRNRGFIKNIFTKFVNSRAVMMNNSLPLEPPRLRRSIQLQFFPNGKKGFTLCRRSKAGGYNVTVEVTELSQLSVDF